MKPATLYVIETPHELLPGFAQRSGFSAFVHDRLERLAQVRRERKARRQRIRERVLTAKLIADLPYDIRGDIGWPWRYDQDRGED